MHRRTYAILATVVAVALLTSAGLLTSASMAAGSSSPATLDMAMEKWKQYADLPAPASITNSDSSLVTKAIAPTEIQTRAIDDAMANRVQADTIFPPDERVRVSPAASYVANLVMLDSALDVITCSGTFIGQNVVLTSAHCIYNPQFGGWISVVYVIPGDDGTSTPYGVYTAAYYSVPTGWTNSFSSDYDWGIVTLDYAIGNAVGWMTLGVLTTSILNDPNFQPVTVGYPGDKPSDTQWATIQPSFLQVSDTLLYHRLDAYPGQSGSGVFRNSDGLLVGVMEAETASFNTAIRVRDAVINNLINACFDLGCSFSYVVETPPPPPTATPTMAPTQAPPPTATPTMPPTQPPPPTSTPTQQPPSSTPTQPPTATATPTQPPPTATPSSTPNPQPPSADFGAVWSTTDQAVANGQASYSWFWGPQPNDHRYEPYAQSPNGQREVQYYDKSRMEINNPNDDHTSIYYVTNGLLTEELVTGKLQTGNSSFNQLAPATVPVAGDPANHPGTPSYVLFAPYTTTDGASNRSNDQTGQAVTSFLYGTGSLSTTDANGVTLASFQSATGHNIPNVFWEWMNDPANGFRPDQGVNWLYALGYPVSEPFWIDSTVGGVTKRVLVQLYERRVLTFTPSNAAQYQIEFGNIGQHYHRWRYGN